MCMIIGFFSLVLQAGVRVLELNGFFKGLPQQACTPHLSHSWLPRLLVGVVFMMVFEIIVVRLGLVHHLNVI